MTNYKAIIVTSDDMLTLRKLRNAALISFVEVSEISDPAKCGVGTFIVPPNTLDEKHEQKREDFINCLRATQAENAWDISWGEVEYGESTSKKKTSVRISPILPEAKGFIQTVIVNESINDTLTELFKFLSDMARYRNINFVLSKDWQYNHYIDKLFQIGVVSLTDNIVEVHNRWRKCRKAKVVGNEITGQQRVDLTLWEGAEISVSDFADNVFVIGSDTAPQQILQSMVDKGALIYLLIGHERHTNLG